MYLTNLSSKQKELFLDICLSLSKAEESALRVVLFFMSS